MNKLDFLIDWYNREEARRTALETSLNIPIGILTVLFAIHFYLFKEFEFQDSSSLEIIVLAGFVLISIISGLIASFFLLKSYHNLFNGFKYTGLPYATELFRHEKELLSYYEEHKDYYTETDGKKEFDGYLISKLAEHIDRNAFNNDKKSEYLHSSKKYLFISILTVVIAFIPFIYGSFGKTKKAQQVEIINLIPINERIKSLENQIIKLQKEMAEKQTPKAPPPPPTPPADRVIREGSNPTPPPPQRDRGK
jgi:hypothetical protein